MLWWTDFFLFRHGEKESIVGRPPDALPSRSAEEGNGKFFFKKYVLAVDGRISLATLLTPLEAGLPCRKTRELVLA
jgi:hypothetical protein